MVQVLDDSRPRPIRGSVGMARIPPNNLEAEESLLGAMLLSGDATAAAIEICGAEDFYKPAHGHIFGAIMALFERGEPIDAVTVRDELTRSGLIDSVGDPAVLVSLQANTPSIANAMHYARIVEEHALLRRMIGVAGEIADIGYSVPEDVEGAIDQMEAKIFNVAQRRTTESIKSLHDVLLPSLDRIEELSHGRDTVTGITTGYADLDKILAGLQPSSLTIVGARPATGKTSLALGILAHVGVVLKRPSLLFSLEMGHLELCQRLLASEARVDGQRVRTGRLQEDDWRKLGVAVSRLDSAPIFIDDNPTVSVMDIRARARRLRKTEGDLGVVVVDYLQLMTGRARAENRQVEVSEMSRSLKILETPVIALSQLSRGLEARQDKRPMLSDLRESGSLEQDADVVLFIYREEQYDRDIPIERRGDAEIIVAKHRNGPTGSAHLAFVSHYARFQDAARV